MSNTSTRKINYGGTYLKSDLSRFPKIGKWRPSKKQGKKIIAKKGKQVRTFECGIILRFSRCARRKTR